MAQGVLPFKYEEDSHGASVTALGGLPVYLDLANVAGLRESVQKHLHVRCGEQGWTDSQFVMAVVMLNLAGGSCVKDLDGVEGDGGFCEVFRQAELHGLRGKARRALKRRWRKERKRTVPSQSALFRYLSAFHDPHQEKLRPVDGGAFIPTPNSHLRGFLPVNKDLLLFLQRQNPDSTATLDMDATLVETSKQQALWCYKGYKAYQPLNTWWAEQGVIVHSEFRDGNVPAGYEQLRVFKEALDCLPQGVQQVRLRSDTAGYQHELLRYCELGEHKRFGRIEFAVGSDVTPSFKEAVSEVPESQWSPLYKWIGDTKVKTGVEWAEVCFVPNAIGHSKKGPEYRYLAKREAIAEQQSLPGMEGQLKLPFPVMKMNTNSYKVFGIVTNMKEDGEALIQWLHKRCGKSEEAHAVMKEDLAGGKLPSGDFGENAAWWWMMLLALNLNAMMKMLALQKSYRSKRMKAIRFSLINIPARLVEHSRRLLLRLPKGHPSLDLLIKARSQIAMLQPVTSG